MAAALAAVKEERNITLELCAWGFGNVETFGPRLGHLWRTSMDIRCVTAETRDTRHVTRALPSLTSQSVSLPSQHLRAARQLPCLAQAALDTRGNLQYL